MEQPRQRQDFARRITRSFLRDGEPFAIRNARKVDARGVRDHAWVVSDGESLVAVAPLTMIVKPLAVISTFRTLRSWTPRAPS